MAVFEVFIPGKETGMPNVTLTIEAANWIGALRSGLKSIGEGQEAIANVMCDIKEDNSIHVTDVATRRVFRLREQQQPAAAPPPSTSSPSRHDTGPRPISIPDGAPVGAKSDAPKTLLEFQAPKIPMPAPAPTPASSSSSSSSELDQSIPWTKMPGPNEGKIPDPRKMVAPAPEARVPLATPMPVSTPEVQRPSAPPTPAPVPSSSTAAPTVSVKAPTPSAATAAPQRAVPPVTEDPDTIRMPPVSAASDTERTERPAHVKPASRPSGPISPPTPRGVPAPAPKRPSGQFSAAPEPKSREISTRNPTDPAIGRSGERPTPAKSVQDAIAAVFDATQDLYMESALSAQKVADKLLDIALSHIPAESGTFYLADVNGHELTFSAVRGPKADALKRSGMTVPVGQGIIGFCAQEGVCLAVSDIQKDPRFLAAIAKSIDYQPKDTLCASAEKDGRLFGAVQLINSKDGFDASHMEVLRFIGLTAAAVLERIAEHS